MQPFVASGVYINYLDKAGTDRVQAAYGSNYERLAALKTKYDPTNLFRCSQNVPRNLGQAVAGCVPRRTTHNQGSA